MTTIEQLLGDLLLRHNCVIVPGFGGFVARQVSARIDYSSGKMHPPSKSLLFNKQLVNNDGLLVAELARENALSYDQALQNVRELVGDWQAILRAGQRIELDRIGYLFLDAEKNLCFEQDRFFNLLLESFGLGQVHFLTEEDVKIAENTWLAEETEVQTQTILVPVMETKEQELASPLPTMKVVQSKKTPEERATVSRRKVWRYVAAACILPIAFYSVWIPMKTDVLESKIISLQDFNPFHNSAPGAYESEDVKLPDAPTTNSTSLEKQIAELDNSVAAYTFAYVPGLNIPVILERAATEEPVTNRPVPDVQPQTFSANSMEYVVGCFGSKDNANNLVAKLKSEGFDAHIVDIQNGLHRVSAGAALSEEAFAKIISRADASGYTGWILK